MKKIYISFLIMAISTCAFAQNTAKSSPYVSTHREVVESGKYTYYFDGKMKYQLGFTVPFFHGNVASGDISSRYGVKAEVGYLTQGQYSFYGGLAYQFIGVHTNNTGDAGRIGVHALNIPAQFSMRFPASVPINFRVGPYLGLVLNGSIDNQSYTKSLDFGDRFGWGFQFNFAVSYFQLGYTLEYSGKNSLTGQGFKSSMLTIGVIF